MEKINSPWLGEIDRNAECELFFPGGLPGFEGERHMLPVEIPAQRPLVYLQSLEHEGICFLTLPIFTIDPGFELSLTDDERAALSFDDSAVPAIGENVLCLALLVPHGETVEANLNAPVVVNLENSRGVQCVATGARSRTYRLADDGTWVSVC